MAKSVLRPGVRVVRGPDWNCKKQDQGEGFLGTVIFVPKKGSADNKVTVIWDSGRELRYRAGQDGKYDLRVFDTAQIGIVHDYITCDGCTTSPIYGMRWKCSECKEVNLCSPCYMNNKHDVRHGFMRIDVEKAVPWAVPPRCDSKTLQSKGIFPGAEVMRGPHWKWKNQDGEEGQVGTVKQFSVWDQTWYRGGVEVLWKSTGEKHLYRLGGEGCVDVIYTRVKKTTSGGEYYFEHLPLCDVVSPGEVQLKPSDKVSVSLNLRAFKQLQSDDMFGWEDSMEQCMKEIGTIIQMLHGGKAAKVQYQNSKTYTMNRTVLTRKHTFSKDETVSILSDYNTVRQLQEGHGGWNDDMKGVLGKVGRILKIDHDGDVRVKVNDKVWIFSPVCIELASDECKDEAKQMPQTGVPASDEDMDDEGSSSESELGQSMNDVAEAIAQLFVDMLRAQPGVQTVSSVNLVQAAAQGDFQAVKDVVTKHKEKINQVMEGKTALQLACYEGHTQIVDYLLENNASKDTADMEGDTPLHYAAFGMEKDAMESLIKHKANKNATNKKGQTPLHIAVGKGSPECTGLLINYGVDVNIKDRDGDTAMHDAVQQKEGQPHIMQLVLKAKGADHSIANAKGFNVLQWATIRNQKEAVELVLKAGNGKIVNDQMKDEKATALHLAALNNHVEIVNALICQQLISIDLGDKTQQTALHLAVLQAHQRVVELLVAAGANVNKQDANGNTPLHLAQSKQSLPQQLKDLMGEKKSDGDITTQIICFLLESKADISIKNKDGNTPLDLAADPLVKKFMKMISDKAKHASFLKTNKGITLPTHWTPMDRGENCSRIQVAAAEKGMSKMEFDSVSKKFHNTLPQAKIVAVERVQNVYLWEVYYLKKRQMESSYGFGCANELDLFHGTLPQYVDKIARENLDFRLAGNRVGAIFGQGAYFAVEAKYSDLYAQADEKRHKFMIIVKALVGKYCIGKSDYRRPPLIDSNDPHSPLYDSCVDNVTNPKIYCLFDTNQYYPEYIIEYQ